MIENLKIWLAVFFDKIGVLDKLNKKTLENKNRIRVINYHRTPANEMETFKKQIKYFRDTYQNINYHQFNMFKENNLTLDKQGLVITFDDGLKNNYQYALKILEENGFTGYFFVSVGLLNTADYMSYDDLSDILNRGHVIGCHTYTHHRMHKNDTNELLEHEIVESKNSLEKIINKDVEIFCWCGGEENTYTKSANDLIKKNYKYAFMTNNELVENNTDNYHLQRTNIEARWPISLCKFQLCGIMDKLYKNKRNRVNKLTE